MNHPSEWARFYDERTGRYRYKHKGSGIIRDTLMSIGKVFSSKAKSVAKKAAEVAAAKVGEKIGEKAATQATKLAERGSDKIQQILRGRRTKATTPTPALNAPPTTNANKRRETMLKLNRILANDL